MAVVPDPVATDPWAGVVGQERAAAQLRSAAASPVHGYLLVGPSGSGKRRLARAFAAALLADGSTGADAERHTRLALAEAHPDFVVVERSGAFITVDQARDIVRRASRAPVEGRRQVLLLTDFHLVQDAAPTLLKAIEEPPPPTVFVLLADDVPPELVTIASRCVRIDLDRLPDGAVADRLVADGVDRDTAAIAAAAAGGDLGRAGLLATDPGLARRRDAWRAVPVHLDGTGAAVARLVAELRTLIDDAQAPLDALHATEAADLEERVARLGERGAGRADLVARHRRQIRRHRTDELRFGLATLAARYRDALGETGGDRPGPLLDAVGDINRAAEALIRNPNEALLLQALLLRLPPLRSGTSGRQ